MRKLVAIILGLMFCSCAFEEPQFITVDVYNCDRIAIDGNFVELSSSNDEFPELKSVIFSKSKDLDSVQRSNFFVKLSIAPDAKMGQINLVKKTLREANILNLKYYEIENLNCGI